MKIIQFMASSGGVGGLEQHTFNLVNELAKKHDVYFIAHPCYKNYIHENVHFCEIDLTRSRLNPFLLGELMGKINTIQADILHCQAGKATELINMITPFLKGIKRINTIHGTKSNKTLYYKKSNAVIGVSRALITDIPKEKAHVIYNGILPMTLLTESETQQLKHDIYQHYPLLEQDKPLLICIGRLEPVKNMALLLNAMTHLSANLWIVGDGSLKSALEQQVKQLNLQHKVAFLGYRTDARQLMQCADVVVLSSDREGFPLVMVEALQAEKVMVSTRVNGVVEWLPEPYLAEIGNVEQLTQAIQHALTTQSQADFQPLFLKAQQELTVQAMTEQTECLYQQLFLNQKET